MLNRWKHRGAMYGAAFLLALTCTPLGKRAAKAPVAMGECPREEDGLADIARTPTQGGPIPATPAANQKGPPCDPMLGEREIQRGCYVGLLDLRPPCGSMYEHGGACFRPVFKAKREPTSVQQ